jgi:hypothetical protein
VITVYDTRRENLRRLIGQWGGPTCQTGRSGGSLRGEHITLKYSEFSASRVQCDRCRSSKLFSFLERQTAKALATQ